MALNPFQMVFGGNNTQQQSSSTQTAQSTSTPSNYNPFTGALQGTLLNLVPQSLPQYGGPLAAPMTGNENSTLQQLMTMQGQGGGAAGTNDYLTKVMSGNFLPGQPGGNPFLQDAITAAQRPTMNNLETTLSRSLPGYFTANGHMISPNDKGSGGSSAFDTAAAIATRGAAQTMGDIATNISSNAYGQERQNQQQAVALSQQEIGNTIQNLQAQSLPRMIQELGIERGLNLYQTNVTQLLQLLSTLGGIAQPVLGNAAQSTSTGTSSATGKGESTPGILAGLTNAFKPSGGGGGATPSAAAAL